MDGPGGVIPDRLEVLAARRPPIPMLIGNDHDEHFGSSTGFFRINAPQINAPGVNSESQP